MRVSKIAFAPDGKTFATATLDGATRVWDVSSRSMTTFLERQARPILNLAYHPSGKTLATSCADGKIRLWDPATGKELNAWDAGSDQAGALAFSADGRHLFWSGAMEEICWVNLGGDMDATPSDGVHTFKHKQDPLRVLAFHPDGRRLLGASTDGAVIVWDWDGKEPRHTVWRKEHAKAILDLAISPDGGRVVTVGADACVKLWDLEGAKVERAWELRWPILGVAFAPDGRHFATANANSTIYMFRIGARVESLAAH
jgi:WD40 repeat protein